MKYNKFIIKNYRAIKGPLEIDLKNKIVPLVGINECGKTTILQAIFAFDYTNDELNKSKQIHDISNLYFLEDDICEIKAIIDISKEELIKVISNNKKNNENQCLTNNGKLESLEENSEEWNKINNQNNKLKSLNSIYSDLLEKIEEKIEQNDLQVELIRTLNEDEEKNRYRLYHKVLNKVADYEKVEDDLGIAIIMGLPPILYSDDFNDRPPEKVPLTIEGNSSEWEKIYTRVFTDALHKENYSIYSLYDEDSRRRKSTLSEVSKYLSDNLTDAWSRFSSEKKKITISFDIEEITENEVTQRVLQIDIIENINGRERAFGISDRSKGFIWYYNFIMKIQFSPKQSNSENTIFLLDEPGSYLHETAQNELCKKLVEISKNEGNVIYCTHSPQLLNPEYIPLNAINIVSKTKSKISCSPIGNAKTISLKTSAFQPVYEALQIPEFKFISKEHRVVIVEGIYDKYALEMFSDLNKDVIFFGSANAKSIRDNIQYFIAFSIPYMALWDNDGEGQTHYNSAKKEFGDFESKKFYLLPDVNDKGKVRMEEMFEETDMKIINDILELPNDASYTMTMGTLYYSRNRERILKEVKSKLSPKTIASFSKLDSIIKNQFSIQKKVTNEKIKEFVNK